MTKPDTMPDHLTAEDLSDIRAQTDWRALFEGLGLRKCNKKSRDRDWWAYSPFHDENTPSFHMAEGGIWYDFSIGEGGGPIELVQAFENVNCYEAGRLMIERGWSQAVITTKIGHHKTEQARHKTKTRVNKFTKSNPAEKLQSNPTIRQSLLPLCDYHDYLEARGISQESCDALGIGYLAQGRSPLKGRIVFQIADARNDHKTGAKKRVILSHIGRAVEDAQTPKYLFYEGFHKGLELYGQEVIWLDDDATAQIAESGYILLTEGPFDLAKAYEAGLRNVVASFGANLANAQAKKIKQMMEHFKANKVIIAFDRDEAGQIGAQKAAQALGELGITTEIFDWTRKFTSKSGDSAIPPTLQDLADLSPSQIAWLRTRKLL